MVEGLAPVAVLARVATLLIPIARACEQRGLTVRVTAETPLAERKEIRDLIAYLRVLVTYLGRYGEPDDTERRWGHVEELIELAAAWERRHGSDIREFLDHLVLSETDDGHVPAQVVGLTLHSAKGLEFDACVIAGVEEA